MVNDSYAAYSESSLVGVSPLQLVVLAYEGAIGAVQGARQCFASGDIMGRSKAITKAVSILTELMISLDHQKSAEVSANLKRLYSYMQQRLLLAHTQKTVEPVLEVEGLLSNLLEAWKTAEEQSRAGSASNASQWQVPATAPMHGDGQSSLPYGSYFYEAAASSSVLGEVYSF